MTFDLGRCESAVAVCLAQNDSTLNKVIQKCETSSKQTVRAQAIGGEAAQERQERLISAKAIGHLPKIQVKS